MGKRKPSPDSNLVARDNRANSPEVRRIGDSVVGQNYFFEYMV